MSGATDYNRRYYSDLTAGRENYWRLMPAPKMRVRQILSLIGEELGAAGTVCDFGCGNGGLLHEIASTYPGLMLQGIDLSGPQIDENRRIMPDCLWAQADLTAEHYRYPFGVHCDLAVSSEVIEHLDDPLRYLKNISTSLRANGALVLTTQSGPVHETERHVGHVRHWTSEEMVVLLRDAGFHDTRVFNCGFPFHDLSKWFANVRPQQVIRRFGQNDWGLLERMTAAILRMLFVLNSSRRGYQLVAVARR